MEAERDRLRLELAATYYDLDMMRQRRDMAAARVGWLEAALRDFCEDVKQFAALAPSDPSPDFDALIERADGVAREALASDPPQANGECPEHKWMGRVAGSPGPCPQCCSPRDTELKGGGR